MRLFAAAAVALVILSTNAGAAEKKSAGVESQIESLRDDLRQESERRRELEKLIDDLTREKDNGQPRQPQEREMDAPPAMEMDDEGDAGEPAEESVDRIWKGMEFAGGVTGVVQGTSAGGGRASSERTGSSYSAAMEMIYHQDDNYYLITSLTADSGLGGNGKFATDIMPDYGARRTEGRGGAEQVALTQAFFEGLFLERKLAVNLGKLDIHSLYDENILAGNENTGFLSGALNRAAGTVGRALDYNNTVGARALASLSQWAEAQVIYAHSGLDGLESSPFSVFQFTLRPGLFNLEGNYRFYAAHDGRVYHDAAGNEKSGLVYGFNFDQFITDNVGFFFRWSAQAKDVRENRVTAMYSGGLTLTGGMWGRVDDLFGLGYAKLELNDTPAQPYEGGQGVVEAYYNVKVNPMVSVSFDVQFHSMLPQPKDRDMTVAGARARIDF
ncbi:MAG: carbohydrate porin [Nitrospinae bacterium]|nr:carbohydrate porin [Nitrospinota bacterium]